MPRPRPTRARIPWAILLGLLTACEEPFEPIQQSDYVFSIYGHLEATADTQWVRVTSIRTALESFPEPMDAVVTLEEIETGTTVVMNGSLVHYRSVNFDEEVYAHNFSTTLPMVPGRHYRLTATRSDGVSATATVLIPVIEDPVMEASFRYYAGSPFQAPPLRPARGSITGMRHIGMVLGFEDVDYMAPLCPHPFPVHQQYLRVLHQGDGVGDPHVALLQWVDPENVADAAWAAPIELRPPYVTRISMVDFSLDEPAHCDTGPKTISVIASGEEWLYGETTNIRERAHPAGANTIDGGIGFLAGVQTHVFPFETCVPLTRQETCKITFSERSARLRGVVTSSCDGSPVEGALVTMRGAAAAGLRYDTTDASGAFGFEGIDPGVAQALSLRRSGYLDHEIEPPVLGEAAVDTVGITMEPRECEVNLSGSSPWPAPARRLARSAWPEEIRPVRARTSERITTFLFPSPLRQA